MYFRTEERQKGESEAEKDIKAGRISKTEKGGYKFTDSGIKPCLSLFAIQLVFYIPERHILIFFFLPRLDMRSSCCGLSRQDARIFVS